MTQKRHKARKAQRRAWHMKYTKPGPERDARGPRPGSREERHRG